MIPTTAGYTITVRSGRIYLVDQHPDRGDCRISVHEAKELAQRLLCAAEDVERDQGNRRNSNRRKP